MITPPAQPARTPATRRRRRRWPRSLVALAAVLLATLVHLGRNGYAFGGCSERPLALSASSDHSNVLPWVHSYADPALLSGDLSIEMGAGYATPLWRLIGIASRALPLEWLVFAVYLAALTTTHLALFLLARALGGGAAAGWIATLAFTAVRTAPAGVETFDPALYTRVAALPLALGALLLLHERPAATAAGRAAWPRPAAAIGLLSLAFVVHPLTGVYTAAVAAPLCGAGLRASTTPFRRRLAVLGGVAAVVLGGAALAAGGAVELGPPTEQWLALQRGNNGMHLFPRLWGEGVWRELGAHGLFLLAAVLADRQGGRRRTALAAIIGGAGLALAGWWAAESAASKLLLQLQPFRGFALVLILALVVAAIRGAGAWPEGGSARLGAALVAGGLVADQLHLVVIGFAVLEARGAGPRRWLSLAAATVVLAWLVAVRAPAVPTTPWSAAPSGGPVATAPRDWPFLQRPANAWIDVQLWCARHTDRDALILTPPDLEGFRSFSRRSHVADWKQGTLSLYHDAFGAAWLERMRHLLPRSLHPQPIANLALNYDALTAEEIAAVVARYGVTHVVVREPRSLPYRALYGNGAFRVYATGR